MTTSNTLAPGLPGMLELVRTARGLTQGELAAAAGMSQGLLSKAENGKVALDGPRLEALAKVLRVPVSRLTHSGASDAVLTACAFHRKRSSLSVSDAKRLRAQLDLTRLEVEPLVEGFVPPLKLRQQSPADDVTVSPEDIARSVRRTFSEPHGPLTNLVRQVEADGVLLVSRDLGSDRIDALGSWPTEGRPLFLVNERAAPDRARFTLAHELGHAVMHPAPTESQEREADRFASELLMPAPDIRSELSHLSMARLVELKARWRVSMAALVRRARDLGAITDADYRRLSIELGTAGYRTREPGRLELERPRLVTDAVQARRQHGQDTTELARLAGLDEDEFTSSYGRVTT